MESVRTSNLPAGPTVSLVVRDLLAPVARHLARGTALAAAAFMSIAASAAQPPYNPDHLSDTQIRRVGEICQNVMGLRPSQALTDNLWPGDPDPASQTNDYRGCIATLSNSLKAAAAPRLASLSVLPLIEQPIPEWSVHVSTSLPREQRACAELGLDPNQTPFKSCVRGLQDVRSAGFMADAYKN